MIKLNYSYTILFASTVAGVGTAADSTPTAVLWRNGSASGTTVVVSTTAQAGLYKAVFTTGSGWSNDDFLELYVTATIAGTAGYLAKVWSSTEIGAAVLDSASLIRFVTEDTGETAAADGSVAKLSQGTSGSGSVTVLPVTGIVANRSAGVTLLPVIGETISQAITVYQSDGTTAVNLSGKTLRIIFETMSGVDVAVVQAADITIGGTSSNVVTFAYPATVTASERTLRFAIRDAAAPLTMYLQGVCSVVRAPQVDA
jgi:hypothetical protein